MEFICLVGMTVTLPRQQQYKADKETVVYLSPLTDRLVPLDEAGPARRLFVPLSAVRREY
jgi:hypothetical protein